MPDNRKLHPARILTVVITLLALVAGTFVPGFSVAAASATPRQAGPHIMPFNPPPPGGAARPAFAPAGAHLTYYDGPVISNMKLVLVGYGPGTYISETTPRTWIPAFVSQYLGSGVMDWLNEYNTTVSGGTNQVIGRGSYLTMEQITPASTNNGSTIQDSNIQNELNRQISAGTLPLPDANTSYAVFFRLNQSICMGGSCSLVAGGFCAYHGTFTAFNGVVATYQVMPDLTGTTGCGTSNDLGNTTSVLSHELIETVTDPQVGFATVEGPPLAWYDSTNGEIADICNAQQGTFTGTDGNTYTVQQQFSNLANNCIVTRAAVPDFSIGASPATLSVAQGASGSSTISTAVTAGAAGSVSLGVSGAPAGVTASLSPTSVTAGGSATLSMAVDPSAAPGTYTLTVTGTEGAFSHTATVDLTVAAVVVPNDFSIGSSPATLSVAQGASGSSIISTAVTSGSAETVSLSVSGAPSGVTASLSPTSVTAGGSATLSMSVGPSAAAGTYTLTVTGSAPSATHTATVSLTVTAVVPNDFSIGASPATLSVAQGASGTSTISTAVTSGLAETVSLSVSGAPAGVTASLSPSSVTAGGSAALTMAVGPSAAAGTYTLTVTGSAPSATHSATVSLTVTVPVPNDFSIGASPATLSVAQGASGTSTISTAVTSGSAGSVSLGVTGAPSGVTATLSPSSVTAGGSAILTLAVGPSAAAGTYTLTVTGTEGTFSHAATVALTVTSALPVFPTTPVLDSFNRANGGVGANWSGATSVFDYFIASHLLYVGLGGRLVWKPASFGASQEAFVTLGTLDSRRKVHGVALKVQASGSTTPGLIVVAYDPTTGKVRLSTQRLDGTLVKQYADTAAVFANGDQLGAQALANGTVKIYKNGTLLATITLTAADQTFFDSKGGRIGLVDVVGLRPEALDNFGGGNVTP